MPRRKTKTGTRPSQKTKKTEQEYQEIKEDAFKALAEVEEHEETEFEAFKRTRKQEQDERVPGKKVGGTKTAWTMQDILERWKVVDFVPEETTKVIFNGVPYQFLANAINHVPEIFVKQYQECKRKAARAGQSLPDTGFQTIIQPGAGALEPE